MERRTGRDLGLALRMGAALVLLAFLSFPLPVACVMVVLSLTHSWLLAVGALAVIGVGVCYLPALSERIAVSSANATELAEGEEPELRALVGRLAAMADLPAPRLALSPTDVPNAFAAGRSPRDAVIVVTRGLLRRLGHEELEAVLAHEFTHVASRDAFVMTLIGAPAMLGKRIFDAIIRAPGRVQTPGKIALFFAFLYLLFPLFFGWVLYALVTALVRTVSRYREFVADRGSVLLTGEPEALQSALQRLAGELPLIPKEDLRQVAGANALFIVPVAAEGSPRRSTRNASSVRIPRSSSALPDWGSSPRKSGARFRRKGTRFSRASVLRSGQTRERSSPSSSPPSTGASSSRSGSAATRSKPRSRSRRPGSPASCSGFRARAGPRPAPPAWALPSEPSRSSSPPGSWRSSVSLSSSCLEALA